MSRDLITESENEFRRIVEALAPIAHQTGPIADSYTIAWRMMMRLEEARLRHPY